MIHYHGGPVTPNTSAIALWQSRHAMVSFAHPEQIAIAAEICQSFALDNGAYSAWKIGAKPDWNLYAEWVDHWGRHPGCDFALIPDTIDGEEKANDDLISWWLSEKRAVIGVSVWHLHESLERLDRMSWLYPWRVALGSSGKFAKVGTSIWWERMSAAMEVICDERGRPRCKLHGLRMLNPTVFSHIPLSSADSTNVARNISLDTKWKGPYHTCSDDVRALILAERIESHSSAARWVKTSGTQENLELIG